MTGLIVPRYIYKDKMINKIRLFSFDEFTEGKIYIGVKIGTDVSSNCLLILNTYMVIEKTDTYIKTKFYSLINPSMNKNKKLHERGLSVIGLRRDEFFNYDWYEIIVNKATEQ